MAYPEAIDMFVEKLNKADIVYVIEDEELVLEDGVFEGELAHDNVKNESVMVFTGPKMSGEQIKNFFLSIPSNAPWKRIIKVFANVPKVYVTYETIGDQVEAEDINRVQESIVNTQIELERYKSVNDQAVDNLDSRLTTVENNKAEKSYVDLELSKKADKENTYTKAETDNRIQAKVDAHANRTDNPHSVTKSQVGLGNVENYGVATQKDAEEGTATNKYMTPQRTKQAIDSLQAVKSVAGKTGIVTLSKSDVGLSNVDNVQQASKAEFDSHNQDFTRHITEEERTAWNAKETPAGAQQKADIAEQNAKAYADIVANTAETNAKNYADNKIDDLAGEGRTTETVKEVADDLVSHKANTANPHKVTKSQVGLANVDNVKQASKTEFDSHNNDTTRHITTQERTRWNNTYTKAETNSLIQALIDSAPETLNTLAKIANAINNDPDFATTINNLLAQLEADKLDKSLKGVAGGLAELDSSGHVPSSQLPSYVDDVLEYSSKNNFPAVGETGKIYVATDTNLTYRWSGSAYVEISPSLALGETSSTAYRGDRGKIAYDHSQTVGNPHQTTKADIGLGNVENYGIATQTEAEAGSVNNKYMTPLRVKQAINVLQAVKSVAGKTGNVTLTKDDVGLSNVDNVKQASKTEFDSHNNDATRHITAEERTRWNNKAEVSQIPTKVSELENDENFVTQEELENAGYGDMLKSIYDTDNDGKVDAAEVADSVPWTGVTGKPSTFPPSSHDHSKIIVEDTRNENLRPADLNSVEFKAEFKYRSVVKMPGSGTYCKVLTLVGWRDDSGGAVHQIGFDDNGDVFIRKGTRVSGWETWVKLAREPNVMPKGPLTWNQLKGVI